MDFHSNSDNMNNSLSSKDTHPDSFAIASVGCGILSVIVCCTGILSIPLGALGIIFAILSKRQGKSMSNIGIAGIWLSGVGMALGILMTAYSFFMVFNNPAMFEEFNAIFESMYGMGFEEYLNYLFQQ